jgi:CRP-like cAMP-binding protein
MALVGTAGPPDDGGVTTATLAGLLARTLFDEDVPGAVVDRMAALGEVVDVASGTAVVEEGSACRAMGVVVDGRIALRLRQPGVGDRTILTLERGDVYGWSAVLPPSIATSTGIAVSPSRVIEFDGRRLTRALAEDCELGARVYQRLLAAVARRLGATRLQLLDVYGAPDPW